MMNLLVIPAYEPEEQLIKLLEEVDKIKLFKIIVVDDGSGEAYQEVFQRAEKYAVVLHHRVNLGKGAALKTAFAFIQEQEWIGIVVTADADGQHSLQDIIYVESECRKNQEILVLGSRSFHGSIPWKSRMGNRITHQVFRIKSGYRIEDTQTGLRAFSTVFLPFLSAVPGERYEYEMNVLLEWVERYPYKEVPIETIYRNNNETSHFHPVKDAFRIYKELLKFGGSSLLSFLIDYEIYTLLVLLLPVGEPIKLIVANTAARLVSGTANFAVNRRFVFKETERTFWRGMEYLMLAIVIYLLSTGMIAGIYALTHWNVYLLKIVVDLSLFLFSWQVQRKVIFKRKMVLCES